MDETNFDKKSKEALKTGLKAAKVKRSFFALILKGGVDGTLIVSKLKIQLPDIAAAKKKSGGNSVIRGVCFGEQEKLIFEVAKPPAPVWAKIVKTIAKRDAGLPITAEFRLGKSPDLNGDEDEEGQAAESPASGAEEAQGAGEVAGAPGAAETPVPAAGTQVAPALAALSAALAKLGPFLQAAIKAQPQRKDELLRLAAECQAHIKSGAAAAAKESLLNLGKLVKAPPPGTPPPKTDPALAQLAASMAKLVPTLQAAIKAQPSRKDELLRLAREFQVRIKGGDAVAA